MVRSFWLSALNWIKQGSIGCINFYKYVIAPYIPSCCRFELSCSDYTKLQIKQYGVWQGVLKGIIRLLHCHPFAKNFHE